MLAGGDRLITEKNWKILILTFSPITLHLLLSSQKIYPFDLRLIVYTVLNVSILAKVYGCTATNVYAATYGNALFAHRTEE